MSRPLAQIQTPYSQDILAITLFFKPHIFHVTVQLRSIVSSLKKYETRES